MSLMMFGQVLSLFGSMQQASAQRRQAARVAEQQEFNAKLERIRGQQSIMIALMLLKPIAQQPTLFVASPTVTLMIDRLRLGLRQAKDKSIEQIDRARVNSMFAENRMRYQAENTRRRVLLTPTQR
jgi:hypothetical protein